MRIIIPLIGRVGQNSRNDNRRSADRRCVINRFELITGNQNSLRQNNLSEIQGDQILDAVQESGLAVRPFLIIVVPVIGIP